MHPRLGSTNAYDEKGVGGHLPTYRGRPREVATQSRPSGEPLRPVMSILLLVLSLSGQRPSVKPQITDGLAGAARPSALGPKPSLIKTAAVLGSGGRPTLVYGARRLAKRSELISNCIGETAMRVMTHFRPTISLKGWEASHLMFAYPAV